MPKLDENPPDSDSPDLQFLDHERALGKRVPRKNLNEDYEYNLFDTLYIFIDMSQVPRDLADVNDPFVGPMSVQGQTPGSAQSSIPNIQLGINTPGMGICAQTEMVGQFPSASGFAFPGGGQTPGLGQLSYYGMGLQATGWIYLEM